VPFRPCFIVGCERSGTTLLAVLLDRHSSLAVTPETHFLICMPRVSQRLRSLATHQQLIDRFYAFPRTSDLGLDRVRLLQRFQTRPPTPPALFQCILEEYAAFHRKARAGEKTPVHIWFVPKLIEWFPDCRVVGIVRDGRDVIRSMLRVPWNIRRQLRPLCLTWVHGARAAERYRAKYPRHFRLVRYEDLLTQPELSLRAIDEFLGLTFEAGQLAPEEPGDASSRVVPPWESEWKAKALEPLDTSRIGDWKKHVTDRERLIMNSMMGPELIRMGYPDTQIPATPALRRAWESFLNALCKARLYRLWHRFIGRSTANRSSEH
jgi:hypothetical protein